VAIKEPYPDLDELLDQIGEGGARVADLGMGEGSAGNISVCVGWPIEVRRRFPIAEAVTLPQPAPHLAGHVLLVTGSGRRLREISRHPLANLGAVVIDGGGLTGTIHTSPERRFDELTTEWNSHLAVHDDTVERTGTNFHAVVHAQPPHLTYLSHITGYRDEERFNRRLLRWDPETILHLPAGVGIVPFMVPGSRALMEANVESLRAHRIVLWAKHGAIARSDVSVSRAVDRIEYAETAARYEYMDMVAGGRGEGLTLDEIKAVADGFGVRTTIV
jgi:rhamnulose-1-phosphate aldolase